MSQRLRSPVIVARRSKPPHPSPSPRPRTKNKSKPFEILKRCSSAPLLSRRNEDDVDVDVDGHSFRSGGGTLFRPQTFSDAFVSSPSLFATSPKIYANEVIRLNSLLIKHMLVLLGLVYCSWQNPRRRAQLIWLILNFTITVPAINLRSISSSFLIYRVEIFVFCFGLVLAIFNKSFYYAFYKLHQMAFFFLACFLIGFFPLRQWKLKIAWTNKRSLVSLNWLYFMMSFPNWKDSQKFWPTLLLFDEVKIRTGVKWKTEWWWFFF